MKVKIKDKKQLSPALLEVQFDLLGQAFPFVSGQFFSLTLINPPYADERGNSRKLGFTNSPTVTDSISILTKVGVSAFKKSLQEILIGTEVEIDGIDGHNHLSDDINQQFTWIADAIGVAPFISIAREIKAKNLQNKVTLVYAVRNQEEAVFAQELQEYAKENQYFKFIPIISETNGFSSDLIKTQLPDFQNSLYVITGEQNFVIPAFKILKDVQIEAKNIAMEIFTGY
jgi:predicted ferric reductase